MNPQLELPVPVLNAPHWRVNFRPKLYKTESIESLEKCFKIIEKNKLSFRGWDYPHLSSLNEEKECGDDWIASWSNFMGHIEYWRFYQSTQFIHLFSVREAVKKEWRRKLETDMRSHLSRMKDEDWDNIPGFISIVNFIYQITEIYEFAARLCESQIYNADMNIKIELKDIEGFVLVAPWERAWHSYYASKRKILSHSKDYESDILIATSRDEALKAIVWFFERFGWLSPPTNIIRHDQENLIKGIF